MKENKEQLSWTDKAASKLASYFLRVQTKISDRMSQEISRLSRQRLKVVLVLFCLVSGGFSLYISVRAVFGKEPKVDPVRVEPLQVPRNFDKTGSEINDGEGRISDELYREIQDYRREMDSLGLVIRPGLADSIRILEEIYKSQN